MPFDFGHHRRLMKLILIVIITIILFLGGCLVSSKNKKCDTFIDLLGNYCLYVPTKVKGQLQSSTLGVQEIQCLGQGHFSRTNA